MEEGNGRKCLGLQPMMGFGISSVKPLDLLPQRY